MSYTNRTTITQSQIQPTTTRNYDPHPPPEYDTSTSFSTYQQSSSFNNNIKGLSPLSIFNNNIHRVQFIHIIRHKMLLIQIYQPYITLT